MLAARSLWAHLGCLALGAGCGVTVVGDKFRTQYAGDCTESSVRFGTDVTFQPVQNSALKSSLLDELNDQSDAVHRCYIEALAHLPDTHGRIVMRLLVSAQGKVETVAVHADSTGFPELGCCIASVIHRVRLAPNPQAAIGLEYPFIFRTLRNSSEVEYAYAAARNDAFEVIVDAGSVRSLFRPLGDDNEANHLTENSYAGPEALTTPAHKAPPKTP